MKKYLSLLVLFCFVSLQAKTLEIMSYNVENLFDAKPDIVNGKSKEDFPYLPKGTAEKEAGCRTLKKYRKDECYSIDWTDAKVEMKLNQIKIAVESEKSSRPDFLGLIEVENKSVVEQLAKKLGYTSVEVTESPDERGVDVALIFNENETIKKVSRTEHVIEVERPTRNILEVEFLIEKKYPLTVFVNHWPSLSNPNEWRIKAAEKLTNRIKELQTKNPQMTFIALGDFNTIPGPNPHPFDSVLHKDGLLFDAYQTLMSENSVSKDVKDNFARGSYFYSKEKQWNMLDRIFYSANLKDQKDLDVKVDSFRIHMPKAVLREWTIGKNDDPKTFVPFMVPKSFKHEENSQEKMGFSDHLPIYMSLTYPDPEVKTEKTKKTKKSKK